MASLTKKVLTKLAESAKIVATDSMGYASKFGTYEPNIKRDTTSNSILAKIGTKVENITK